MLWCPVKHTSLVFSLLSKGYKAYCRTCFIIINLTPFPWLLFGCLRFKSHRSGLSFCKYVDPDCGDDQSCLQTESYSSSREGVLASPGRGQGEAGSLRPPFFTCMSASWFVPKTYSCQAINLSS